MVSAEIKKHYRACNLCEAMCGIVIEHTGTTIISIKGDKDDPFSRGHICPKATALEDIYRDEDRLRQPVRKTPDGTWEEISWDEALDEVADKLVAIQAQHGNDAVGIFQGNPNVHNYGSMLFSPPFVRALRTKNRFSATSVDQLPHHFAGYYMFGHQLLLPIPDVDHTDYFLILGANPIASNGSLMTAGGIGDRLKALQTRGGKFVVIDPRRTETAKRADEHFFIKPNSDVMLLLAMVHILYADGLVDAGHLTSMVDGIDALQAAVRDFTPEWAAQSTGIRAEDIRRMTHDFARAERAVIYGRVGVSMQAFGGAAQWLINAINLLTGNLDRQGGAMFTLPAFDLVGITSATGQRGNHGRWRSRVRDVAEFGGELPSAVMAEEILIEGDGKIRAMVTSAGNPILSTPNGQQLDEAFARLDFMVSIDIYINETTRHADIILPPATGLESDHYDIVFHALAVRNHAKYSPILFEPVEGQLQDWEIFKALRERIDTRKGAKPSRGKDLFKRMSPTQLIDLGIRFGPYGAWNKQRVSQKSINLHDLKRNAHGIDLGELKPILKHRIMTDNKRIALTPAVFLDDLQRVKGTFQQQALDTVNGFDLMLIGRRHLRSNNSWMHNSERLVRGKNRCTLMIHPGDATRNKISDGELVRVQSRVGHVVIEAEVSEDVMQGVVSIPHGWGHDRDGIQMDVAQAHAGVSINDLTDDKILDDLTGNAAFSAIMVHVDAVEVAHGAD